MIIVANQEPNEKKSLAKILMKQKKSIGRKITDIKGVSPSYVSHKMNLEEDDKTSGGTSKKI